MGRKKKTEEKVENTQNKTNNFDENQEFFITWKAKQHNYIFSLDQKYFPNRTNIQELSILYSELMTISIQMIEDSKEIKNDYFKKEEDLEHTLKDFAICRFVKNTEDFADIFAWFDGKMNFHPIDKTFDEKKISTPCDGGANEKYNLFYIPDGDKLPRVSLSEILNLKSEEATA